MSGDVPYYKASCKILNLRRGVYSLKVRKLMERIVQLRIDKLLDNYIPLLRMNAVKNMQEFIEKHYP